MKRRVLPPGRPRCFKTDEVLDRALRVFWEKGYEGASLADLTAAMGINRPSLYAAFGNKEGLFRQALDRYAQSSNALIQQALLQPSARQVAQRLLEKIADRLGDPHQPRGCLMVHGALACGDEADPIRRELIARRTAGFTLLRKRFAQAKKSGDLPSDYHPEELARYLCAVMHGMSVLAVNGAKRTQLRQVAKMALRAWPG